jgi:hypothetical protein
LICAVLALSGVFWRGALVGAFLLYLSLVSVSREFLSFQWDFLLLEAGFLAIFLGYGVSVVWLFRWLLFRLMFFSGAVKMLSGDPVWRDLTALTYHFQTQPIPTAVAWYANQWPLWFQKVCCAGVFFVELVIPWLVLMPRRARLFALPWLLALQGLIAFTGNYAFFNLLAASLCLFLIDDRLVSQSWSRLARPISLTHVSGRVRQAVVVVLALVICLLSALQVATSLGGNIPEVGSHIMAAAAPFGIVNSYGLFAVMTKTRPEIIIEGSNDGSQWLEYEFKYKPGRLDRRPPWVAPHQPRLDWQMWFAALGTYRENVWFLNLLVRLLQGKPEVTELLERVPFSQSPPKFVRARVYDYEFTTSEQRKQSGNWWTRKPLGLYVPALSLKDLSSLPVMGAGRQQQP